LPGEEKGEHWKVNQLNFYCSLDTRMLTTEGTQQVVEEKVTAITEILTKTKQKDDLNDKQQAFITRQQSTLSRWAEENQNIFRFLKWLKLNDNNASR
jgi:hypothetical protein